MLNTISVTDAARNFSDVINRIYYQRRSYLSDAGRRGGGKADAGRRAADRCSVGNAVGSVPAAGSR